MAGTGYKGDAEKLVNSDYLYKNLKALDTRRAKKLHDSLFIDHEAVPMHYVASSMGEAGALIIVTDGSVSDSSTQVEESTVNANKLPDDLTIFNVGDYVKKVELVEAYSEEIYLKSSTMDYEKDLLDLDTFDTI